MKVIFLEENQKPEDLIPGIGIPEGSTFEEFGIDMKECQSDPYCFAIGLPSDLAFMDSDLFFPMPNREEHVAFVRHRIATWYYQDPFFTKPLYVLNASTIEEIRLLSGIPNIAGITLAKDIWFDRVELFAAAGDIEALRDAL